MNESWSTTKGNMPRTALPRYQDHASSSEATPLEGVGYSMKFLATSSRRNARRFP